MAPNGIVRERLCDQPVGALIVARARASQAVLDDVMVPDVVPSVVLDMVPLDSLRRAEPEVRTVNDGYVDFAFHHAALSERAISSRS